jgi:hypothetical protein
MPCYQSTNLPSGVTTTGRTSYTTEADCLQACKEGACCEGTTCSVKPQCQCQGAGKVFKGVGTTCSPNPCVPCFQFCKPTNTTPPDTIYFTVSNYSALSTFRNLGNISGTYALQRDPGSCDSYSLALYPTDCNGQPNYCFTLCQKKFVIGVSSAIMFMYAFDQTQQGNSGCQGFYFFRSSGFNSCTTPTAGGSSAAAMTSNQVGASFSWSISANNPLP